MPNVIMDCRVKPGNDGWAYLDSNEFSSLRLY
jgi:hypothetical protein